MTAQKFRLIPMNQIFQTNGILNVNMKNNYENKIVIEWIMKKIYLIWQLNKTQKLTYFFKNKYLKIIFIFSVNAKLLIIKSHLIPALNHHRRNIKILNFNCSQSFHFILTFFILFSFFFNMNYSKTSKLIILCNKIFKQF